MSDMQRPADRFAVVHVGSLLVAVEAARVGEIRSAAGEEVDLDLTELLGVDAPASAERKVMCLRHLDREVVVAVSGSLEVGRRLRGSCHRPGLVAALLERACLRGVVRDGDRLVYLLDVGRIAARVDEPRTDGG